MGGGKENGQKACLWSLETPIPHSGSTLREIDPKNGMAFSMMQKAEDHIHGGGKKKKTFSQLYHRSNRAFKPHQRIISKP